MKAIDDDLHCYHFYGNNASRVIVPNITNKVKKKTCGPCVSFRNFYSGFVNILVFMGPILDVVVGPTSGTELR